jgi:hypothetical protein
MGTPRGAPCLEQLSNRHTTQNERRQNGAHFRSAFHIHETRHDGRQRLLSLIGDRAHCDEGHTAFRRRPGNVVALHVDGQCGAASERVRLFLWRRKHAIKA